MLEEKQSWKKTITSLSCTTKKSFDGERLENDISPYVINQWKN